MMTPVETLAAILIRQHGENAEGVARRRARRCASQSQTAWAAKWIEVAAYLAAQPPTGSCDP